MRPETPRDETPTLSAAISLILRLLGRDADPARSGAFLGVYLKGRDAPDGSPGIFVTDGLYDYNLDVARAYTTRFEPGAAQIAIVGDDVTGRLDAADGPVLDFAVRVRRNERVLNMGTHQYFGQRPGGLNTYSIAFAARVHRTDPVFNPTGG